jgi:tripartite-type tricarboxylate transporter receptor subunit TctC
MTISRRTFVTTVAALGAAGLPSSRASAQAYPDRAIRLIVPFAAGGNADINGRIVADIIYKALGQPVVVENRAGAGGGVGAEFTARAPPDGYTLLIGSNGPLTVNPFVNTSMSYDPANDFAAIAMLSYTPHGLLLSNKTGVKSVAELIALSKTRPVTLATSGVGSATHMTLERFKQVTGANLTHVPYKSSGVLLPDVIAGNIDGAMTEFATSLEQHKGASARIIGIAAASRSKLAPGIGTFDEQGVKGFLAQSFVGVVAPAKTPPGIIAKLQAAIAAGLKADSPSAEKFISAGSELATPEQLSSRGWGRSEGSWRTAGIESRGEQKRSVMVSGSLRSLSWCSRAAPHSGKVEERWITPFSAPTHKRAPYSRPSAWPCRCPKSGPSRGRHRRLARR